MIFGKEAYAVVDLDAWASENIQMSTSEKLGEA